MVFCGKPSKGCSSCRLRRIKCDRAEPACSQCLRVGKTCAGYRDQLNLSFRDENEKVLRKAQVASSSSSRGPSPMTLPADVALEQAKNFELFAKSSNTDYWDNETFKRKSTWRAHFTFVPIQDEGVKFVFQHYVTNVTRGFSAEDLPSSSLWPLVSIDKSFFSATAAVGFAGLSNVTKNPKYMVIARDKYAKALSSLTKALQDTTKVDLANTLIRVMLLAAFEIVSGAEGSTQAWAAHVDGGAAILKLISASRTGTLPKARMQMHLIFSLYTKCLSRGEPSLALYAEWTEKCRLSVDPIDAPAIELSGLLRRYVDLRMEVKQQRPDYHASSIYETALALDKDLEAWNDQLPDTWRFETKPVPKDADFVHGDTFVYRNQMHIYRDLWASRVYCHYRWIRLLVNQLIVASISCIPPSSAVFSADSGLNSTQTRTQTLVPQETQETKSLKMISSLAEEICTSTATHFVRYTLIQAFSSRVPPMTGCFTLIFPLAIAGAAIGTSSDIFQWMVQVFEVFGHEMGIKRALDVVPLMRAFRERWVKGDQLVGFELCGDGVEEENGEVGKGVDFSGC